ncbi:MAG: hypothetical protein U0610_22850 [bacterium]
MKTDEDKRFDVRILDRNLKDRVISQADIDKTCAALPDLADEFDWVDYAHITSAHVGKLAARGEGSESEAGASSTLDLDD